MNKRPPKDFSYQPPPSALDILYEDSAILVVNKPAGLLSVPGKDEHLSDCLETRLRSTYGNTLLVHRLDMDTSGLMVFARKKASQRSLSAQFEARQIQKTYIADIAGRPEKDQGLIDLPLITDWPNRPLQKVDKEAGKPSLTKWQTVSHTEGSTRVELFPLTGRTHQLRVHMDEIGHPILGDRFYGTMASRGASDRLHLHAQDLRFLHPMTQETVEFHCPPNF